MTTLRQKEYEIHQREVLTNAGFDYGKLTPTQIDLIMQPSEAPENYMCDGEITQKQAFAYWKQNLKNSGLKPAQIKLAIKIIN